jgi:hypothetical protein
MTLRKKLASGTQHALNRFHAYRKLLVDCIAFASIRLYAVELAFRDVREGRIQERTHEAANLSAAKDLDTLLSVAKECYKIALDRRNGVTDKCKTLLALCSFILAVSSLFVPKSFEFDGLWMRLIFFGAGLLVLNAVVLLLVYFGVAKEQTLALDGPMLSLSADDAKKSLIDDYLRCEVDSENRTGYLVHVYEAARFYALTGLVLMLMLASVNYLSDEPSDAAERIVRLVRSNPRMVELLRGPKGDKGEKGERGPKGEEANSLRKDPAGG